MLINATQTREYLRAFDFPNLFIEVLGWENYPSRMPIPVSIGGQEYTLTGAAHKRGVGAFVCTPQNDGRVPDKATRRRIERELGKLVHEHLIIYPDAARTMQVWQTVTHRAGKPIASPEHTYYKGQPGDSLIAKLQDIAIGIDEEESIGVVDVVIRMNAAFQAEKVTKKFYERFQKEHDAFLGFITGVPDENLQRWYASVMLNRLMFIYFIQEKGFLDGKPDYLKRKLAESKKRGTDQYYSGFLKTLFFDGFATRKGERTTTATTLLGDIPYLNGGIFAPHQIEQHHGREIRIPDAAFDRLYTFFEAYNWHLDERPLRSDNEINPDVLGYIFEKYINQKQMGAYYTKEDITEYISKNTIVPFLFDAAEKRDAIAFRPDGPVWQLLGEDPDRYIYSAVRKGVDLPLPTDIEAGVSNVALRGGWNRPAAEEYALPTEIWREVVARRQRYAEVRTKLENGSITSINDLITLNLDIRQFAQDTIENAEGSDLVLAFYRSIEKITVLDPTCGSGAFLFAALNILEPLYEACLDKMQAFVDELDASDGKHSPLKYSNFREILAEAGKHANRRYFIYKSIILNNLYGVDIMEEAVEICKLRLFLKLVAQVERDPRKENGGIAPLPDIDFNILAGNTLVGFATEGEVEAAIRRKFDFDNSEGRIKEKAAELDRLFAQFRLHQTTHGGNITAEDKAELRRRVQELRDELDVYLAKEYGVDTTNSTAFEKWRGSHEPFHWFVEFYGIMKRGGFDAIIGNPPYVEYSLVRTVYQVKQTELAIGGNLHSMVSVRSLSLSSISSLVSLIVPVAITSTDRMLELRKLLHASGSVWVSSYAIRPSKLFSGAEQRLSIFIVARGKGQEIYTTSYKKWNSTEREHLFSNLHYHRWSQQIPFRDVWPKLDSRIAEAILQKVQSRDAQIGQYFGRSPDATLYYKNTGIGYFAVVTKEAPICYINDIRTSSSRETTLVLNSSRTADAIHCLLNSSTFFLVYQQLSNCRDLNPSDIELFRIPSSLTAAYDTVRLSRDIQSSLSEHSWFQVRNQKQTGAVRIQSFTPSHSKGSFDEVDAVLAEHYGFTDEELDFIINYDIKYRMGKDAEGEEDEGGTEQTAARSRKAAPAAQPAATAVQAAHADRFIWEPGDLKLVSTPAPAQQPPSSAPRLDLPPAPRQTPPEPDGATRQGTLRVGDCVRHPLFGEGEVLEAVAQGDDQKLTVQFKTAGKKLLMAKAARLERI